MNIEIISRRTPAKAPAASQSARIDDVATIPSAQRQAMLELLAEHFDGVEPRVFMQDLSSKSKVLSLYDQSHELCGFTSFAYERVTHEGQQMGVIYSGDTIMRPDSWNSSLLMPAWIRAVHTEHEKRGGGSLYWLLLSAGFRTYRFLPILFQQFEPSFTSPHCEAISLGLRRFLAERRYGKSLVPDERDAGLDIVRFDRPHQLRGSLAGIPESRKSSPHVQFFIEANPGHEQGDELVCLADLGLENLTAAGRRMWQRGGRLLDSRPSTSGAH